MKAKTASAISLFFFALAAMGAEGEPMLCVTNAVGVVAGYQDLEHLDTHVGIGGGGTSSGQRIVTDFRPQDFDVVEMKVKFLPCGFGYNQFLWCDRTDGMVDTFSAGKMNTGNFRFDRGSSADGAHCHPAEVGTLYQIVVDYGSRACTVNGRSAGTMACGSRFKPPVTLALFASFIRSGGARHVPDHVHGGERRGTRQLRIQVRRG